MNSAVDTSKGKLLIFFPLFYNTVNLLYCLYSGCFTGDYLGITVNNYNLLFVTYVCSFIPQIVLWEIYKWHKKRQAMHPSHGIQINLSFLRLFVYFIFFWHISVSLLFGVNQLGEDAYQAPSFIKVFIQIFNRFPPNLIGACYIALCGNKRFSEFLKIALLMVVFGLVKKSISSPVFIFYIALIFYGDRLLPWFKRHIFLIAFISLLSPYVIRSIYSLRDSLRGTEGIELSSEQLVFGKLFGRLSSLSNSGFIVENLFYFASQAQELDYFYYQKQSLSGVLGMSFAPPLSPEKVLFNSLGDGDPNVSYMCGVMGNMTLSFLRSPSLLLINFVSFVLLLWLTFYLIGRMRIPWAFELALVFQISPVMSGVANECAFVPVALCLFLLLNIVVNSCFIKKRRNEENIIYS